MRRGDKDASTGFKIAAPASSFYPSPSATSISGNDPRNPLGCSLSNWVACPSVRSTVVYFLTGTQGAYHPKVGVQHHDVGNAKRGQVADSGTPQQAGRYFSSGPKS